MTCRHLPGFTRIFGLLLIAGILASTASRSAEPQFDLQAYRGKVVILDFWASWCVPCRRSFPWMNEMQRKYADAGLVVVGVNMDADPDDAQAFLRNYPADFRIVSDSGGDLASHFAVEAMPSSYVIDREGEIVARHLGFQVRKVDEYEERIKQVLFSEEE
ncbi:MAG: TlpA family protein disulfide reductase [Gammaproteobacteria bacterium]|nr:TlpA family protein disulfide reductase [Gammaproteobacteria bacterium]